MLDSLLKRMGIHYCQLPKTNVVNIYAIGDMLHGELELTLTVIQGETIGCKTICCRNYYNGFLCCSYYYLHSS
ncbi:unnamed protein product [Moneuplotes crassus]|uniref:Uncharacterized protein n=1 Tax=Euplotes crassus TaxID=5936 RepID=A0AAD1UAQ5_EUPCR|nr:unnamed protein product [Moneuplotes crassus]